MSKYFDPSKYNSSLLYVARQLVFIIGVVALLRLPLDGGTLLGLSIILASLFSFALNSQPKSPYVKKTSKFKNCIPYFGLTCAFAVSPQPLISLVIIGALLVILKSERPFKLLKYLTFSFLTFITAALYKLLIHSVDISNLDFPYVSEVLFPIILLGLISVGVYQSFQINQLKSKLSDKKDEIIRQKMLIRSVCHDLASPIFAITSANTIIMRDQGSEISNKFSKMIENSSNHLSHYIQKIRELIITTQSTPSYDRVNINSMFAELELRFANHSKNKNVKIIFTTDNENTTILSDEELLKTAILSNLIHNAIKFSKPGSEVYIQSRICKSSCGIDQSLNGCVEISVIDNGSGIKPKYVEKIFAPHIKATSIGSQGEIGSGLGLPIAYEAAKLMNGKLLLEYTNVDPAIGRIGSEFKILLEKI
jgi:signal transduction histidine kinase